MKKNSLEFKDLATSAQIKAAQDYLDGWKETHEIDDVDLSWAIEILKDIPEFSYKIDGTYIESEE